MTELITRCGYIAIVGRPNVGKSTLLNHVLGQKLSITSRKPQTTRHKLIGIKTTENTQYIFVDTPGLHQGQKKAINRYMNRIVTTAIQDVDVVVFLVENLQWLPEDEIVAKRLADNQCPVILAINKVDKMEDKEVLLPHMQQLLENTNVQEIIPISALHNQNLDRLLEIIRQQLPENDYFYPEDQITNRSSRFLSAEIIREKITRQLGDELPYQMTVEIEEFSQDKNIIHIHGLILVEKNGQKRILIGDKGERIKKIGQQAREDMEILFDSKVMLKTWVKVKSGWSDDERALRSLGYDDI
ncbi:GTPase Era [Candidatus Endobugula sertula]|uniref:GTPase Era n=1 Tax=Candidatus Endobugula sertula TaxID=62101 RepID=A0A1D2QN81_9GAMM|nr:GTPase Era [Candidatus Endobugula sertula]